MLSSFTATSLILRDDGNSLPIGLSVVIEIVIIEWTVNHAQWGRYSFGIKVIGYEFFIEITKYEELGYKVDDNRYNSIVRGLRP